ncbi:MAG: aminotransferase class V-fold PLP-dependent enzyme [Actinomycetota bacterium]|nr:aminotransferase class V-fold PLP-dependent enzyme [Actinomycetota bacterium]
MPSLVPRDLYAALQRCTYLNQAALGLIPTPAVEAMHAFIDGTAQHGNLYLSDQQEAEILDGVRSAGAELLGTTADAVAVVGSASEGLGQIASLLEADRGTVVLVSTDFPGVTYPWLAAAQRRAIELRFVEDRPDRDLTQDLVDAIDPTTSVVTFGAVQYATGSQIEVGRVTARAHEAGARVVVDATQVAGAGPVDMNRWGADAVVTSGYKWLSSHGGVALLAVARHLRDRLPQLVGWKGTNDPFAFDARTLRLADDARRFELSTMSYASVVGLESSMAILSSAGFDRIRQHATNLAARLVDQVEGLGWRPFRQLGDPGASPHIVSLRHARHHPEITAARLASDHQIVCGGRGGGLRISLHAYNDEADVDRLSESLRDSVS